MVSLLLAIRSSAVVASIHLRCDLVRLSFMILKNTIQIHIHSGAYVFIDIIFVIIGLHAYWHNSLLNPYFNSDHYLCVSSSLGLITEPLIEQGRWCYLDGRACNFDDISQSESRDFWSKVNEHIKNLKVRKWDVMFVNPSSATLVRRRSNDVQEAKLVFKLSSTSVNGLESKGWSLIDMHNMSRYADCMHMKCGQWPICWYAI